MPKSLKPVTVTFNSSGPSINPDPVPVSRSQNTGIQWTAATSGYTFTGINFDPGQGTDFGTPTISTNAAGKSVMTVTDTVADLGDYAYGISYNTPDGTAKSFDPTIKNKT